MLAVGLVLCGHSAADAELGCAGGARPLPTAARETPAPRVEESQPSIYYLPDKQRTLQPVLDFKYEEFVDLYRLKNQLGRRDQPPRYSLQRITATGATTGAYAEIAIQFQAVVRDNEWVRMPLRLDQGLLRGAVQYKGTGKQIVQYEGDGAGYVCWIRGKPDSQHEITLTMLVPLDSTGDETRLKLCVPRATASEMKLTVAVGGAVGTASEGATLISSADKGGATEFAVVGLGGDFQLAWRQIESGIGANAGRVGGKRHGAGDVGRPFGSRARQRFRCGATAVRSTD